MTPAIDYVPMLRQWSRELLAIDLAPPNDTTTASPDWLGTTPASDATIAKAETRLGVALPPSCHAFLATSDGWGTMSQFVERLRAATEIDWFIVEHGNEVDAWSDSDDGAQTSAEYFDYATPNPYFRGVDLRHALLISDGGDGDVLLNPRAVTPDGEWECWFLASWIPGARRYASFAHWLVEHYASFRELQRLEVDVPTMPRVIVPSPTVKRKAVKPKRAKPPKRPVETLMIDLASTDDAIRKKAAKEFAGRLTLRNRAERRPDLIEPLTQLFRASRDADVRSLCVQMITQSAPDGPTPAAILEAFDDVDPWVVIAATWAGHHFAVDAAFDALVRGVERLSDPLAREAAILTLGDLGDARALPLLARVLRDRTLTFDQTYGSTAIAMARIGPDALPFFVDALTDDDARIRHAAVVGLDVLDDRSKLAHVRPMLDDIDARVRDRASQTVAMREPR